MNRTNSTNEPYFSSVDVINRLSQVLQVKSQRALSKALGKSPNRISELKRAGSLPWEEVIRISVQKDVSLDWLIFGKERSPAGYAAAQEVPAPTGAPPPADTTELVRAIVWGVESALADTGRRMKPERKADLVATLVEMYAETQAQPSRDNIIRLVRNAS